MHTITVTPSHIASAALQTVGAAVTLAACLLSAVPSVWAAVGVLVFLVGLQVTMARCLERLEDREWNAFALGYDAGVGELRVARSS